MTDALADALELTSNEDGEPVMCGQVVRVIKGTPNKFAIVDAIMAVRKIKREAAIKQWQTLLKTYYSSQEVFLLAATRGGSKTPFATIENLINIISKLKGEKAQMIASQLASNGVRLWGGDLTLHDEIDANHSIQQQLVSEAPNCAMAQFGQFVQSTAIPVKHSPPKWAIEWDEHRKLQKAESKDLSNVIRTVVGPKGGDVYPVVENMHNQAVIGFESSTKAFKKDNGIPDRVPMAAVMTQSQLDMRRMMAESIKLEIEEKIDTITKEGIKVSTRVMRDNVKNMCKILRIDGYRDHNVEKNVRQLFVESRKKNKRQELIDKKKSIAAQAAGKKFMFG